MIGCLQPCQLSCQSARQSAQQHTISAAGKLVLRSASEQGPAKFTLLSASVRGSHRMMDCTRRSSCLFAVEVVAAGSTQSPLICASLLRLSEHARRISRCLSVKAEITEGASSSGEPDLADLVELGVFGPPHGIRGEIRLQAITDSLEERLSEPGAMWARQQGGRGHRPLLPLEIEGVRDTVTKGRATWLVKVEGVDSVEEAESLRGHTLHMLADDRPALEGNDELYVQELVGMQVVMEGSRELVGTVTEIFDGTGAHDLLRVERGPTAGTSTPPVVFIPFVKDIVPLVDKEARILGITPPEGLLDIKGMLKNASTTKKKGSRRRRPKMTASGPA